MEVFPKIYAIFLSYTIYLKYQFILKLLQIIIWEHHTYVYIFIRFLIPLKLHSFNGKYFFFISLYLDTYIMSVRV